MALVSDFVVRRKAPPAGCAEEFTITSSSRRWRICSQGLTISLVYCEAEQRWIKGLDISARERPDPKVCYSGLARVDRLCKRVNVELGDTSLTLYTGVNGRGATETHADVKQRRDTKADVRSDTDMLSVDGKYCCVHTVCISF